MKLFDRPGRKAAAADRQTARAEMAGRLYALAGVGGSPYKLGIGFGLPVDCGGYLSITRQDEPQLVVRFTDGRDAYAVTQDQAVELIRTSPDIVRTSRQDVRVPSAGARAGAGLTAS